MPCVSKKWVEPFPIFAKRLLSCLLRRRIEQDNPLAMWWPNGIFGVYWPFGQFVTLLEQ